MILQVIPLCSLGPKTLLQAFKPLRNHIQGLRYGYISLVGGHFENVLEMTLKLSEKNGTMIFLDQETLLNIFIYDNINHHEIPTGVHGPPHYYMKCITDQQEVMYWEFIGDVKFKSKYTPPMVTQWGRNIDNKILYRMSLFDY